MSLEIVVAGQQNPQYQTAVEITRDIRMNGSIAVTAIVQVCKDLKRMRDEKLYLALGYETFGEYAEQAVNIKERQAYNYIATYERLGPSVFEANANLGITKLALLAEAPVVERNDLIEQKDLAGMSTREIEELVKKVKDQGEQLSLITEERDKYREQADEAGQSAETVREDRADYERKIKDLEERLSKAEQEASDPAAYEKTILEAKKAAADKARKEAEKAAREQQKFAVERAAREARQSAEKEIAAARAEGEKAARRAIEASLKAVEHEKAAALERAAQLEKKLQVSGNQETVIVLHLSEELQTIFGSLLQSIAKMREEDAAAADKFTAATGRLLEALKGQLQGA